MATDVVIAVHFPYATEAEIPEVLYKPVTMPVIPRIVEEVWFPGDGYLPVSRVRYTTEDFHVVLHFDDVSNILHENWTPQYSADLNELFQNNGFSATEPTNPSA